MPYICIHILDAIGRYAPHIAALLGPPCLWTDERHVAPLPPLLLARPMSPRAPCAPSPRSAVSPDRGASRATSVSAPLAEGHYAPRRSACTGCEIPRDSWPRGVMRHLCISVSRASSLACVPRALYGALANVSSQTDTLTL